MTDTEVEEIVSMILVDAAAMENSAQRLRMTADLLQNRHELDKIRGNG